LDFAHNTHHRKDDEGASGHGLAMELLEE
jgi:hypothetical protein